MTKITQLDWSKTAKQFSANSHGKFLCQCQASRQASTWPIVFLPQIFTYIFTTFHIGYYRFHICTFHFGKMFNGFSPSTFDFN